MNYITDLTKAQNELNVSHPVPVFERCDYEGDVAFRFPGFPAVDRYIVPAAGILASVRLPSCLIEENLRPIVLASDPNSFSCPSILSDVQFEALSGFLNWEIVYRKFDDFEFYFPQVWFSDPDIDAAYAEVPIVKRFCNQMFGSEKCEISAKAGRLVAMAQRIIYEGAPAHPFFRLLKKLMKQLTVLPHNIKIILSLQMHSSVLFKLFSLEDTARMGALFSGIKGGGYEHFKVEDEEEAELYIRVAQDYYEQEARRNGGWPTDEETIQQIKHLAGKRAARHVVELRAKKNGTAPPIPPKPSPEPKTTPKVAPPLPPKPTSWADDEAWTKWEEEEQSVTYGTYENPYSDSFYSRFGSYPEISEKTKEKDPETKNEEPISSWLFDATFENPFNNIPANRDPTGWKISTTRPGLPKTNKPRPATVSKGIPVQSGQTTPAKGQMHAKTPSPSAKREESNKKVASAGFTSGKPLKNQTPTKSAPTNPFARVLQETAKTEARMAGKKQQQKGTQTNKQQPPKPQPQTKKPSKQQTRAQKNKDAVLRAQIAEAQKQQGIRDAARAKYLAEMICFTCNQKGHRFADCPTNDRTAAQYLREPTGEVAAEMQEVAQQIEAERREIQEAVQANLQPEPIRTEEPRDPPPPAEEVQAQQEAPVERQVQHPGVNFRTDTTFALETKYEVEVRPTVKKLKDRLFGFAYKALAQRQETVLKFVPDVIVHPVSLACALVGVTAHAVEKLTETAAQTNTSATIARVILAPTLAAKWKKTVRPIRIGGFQHSIGEVSEPKPDGDKRYDYLQVGDLKHDDPEISEYTIKKVDVSYPGILKRIASPFFGLDVSWRERVTDTQIQPSLISRTAFLQMANFRVGTYMSQQVALNSLILQASKSAAINIPYDHPRTSNVAGSSDDVMTRTVESIGAFRASLIQNQLLRVLEKEKASGRLSVPFSQRIEPSPEVVAAASSPLNC